MLLCPMLVLGCHNNGEEAPAEIPPQGPSEIEGYTKFEHLGFDIHVQNYALATYDTLARLTLDKVKDDLSAIVNQYEFANHILDSLRNMRFFCGLAHSSWRHYSLSCQ